MNAGLSNLATLKAWLLTAAMVEGTDYDEQILAIGLGVAGQIEKHCDRVFARAVGATFVSTADRAHVIVDRYPIEALTKLELRDALGEGWVDQGAINSAIENISEAAGLVTLSAQLSALRSARLRVTFTGGFWWNQQEPGYTPPEEPTEEEPDLSAQPEGSAALPADLLLAWKLQCEHVWAQRDKLGLSVAEKPGASGLAAIALLPVVQAQLQPFKRYAML